MELITDAIRRARVPAHLGRRASLRGTLECWLATRDLRRYGLPADAIVLVRALRASWAQLAGPTDATRHDALGAVLTGALRPALEGGAMTATAAVWFADAAELLACMARDALAGPLSARWWWRALLRDDADRAAAVRHWTASARAVPRAAERLQTMELGTRWFASWDAPARRALLAELARHHSVSAAVQRFVEFGCSDAGTAPPAASAAIQEGSVPGHAQQTGAGARVSVLHSAPERLHRLCLKLVRDPMCAIDERYIERELRGESLPTATHATQSGDTALPLPDAAAAQLLEPTLYAPTTLAAADAIAVHSREVMWVGERLAAPTSQALPSFESGEAKVPSFQPDDPAHPIRAGETITTAPQTIDRANAGPPAVVARPGFDTAMVFDTQHGGLFFVLNAALQLGLYGDFSQPLQRGLEMSPWQFLHVVGLAFGRRRFARDPLAAWLREGWLPPEEAAACAAELPWRIERDWLRPFAGDTRPLRAVWAAGKLTLLHPAGFAIGATPATLAQCEHWIAAQLAALGLAAARIVRVVARTPGGPASPGAAPPHTALLRVLPYLRARLALALGLRDARQVAGVLLRLPARVRASAERVDVFFALEQLPLAVRLAGLDRDPGWLPAAGRDLRFHFA